MNTIAVVDRLLQDYCIKTLFIRIVNCTKMIFMFRKHVVYVFMYLILAIGDYFRSCQARSQFPVRFPVKNRSLPRQLRRVYKACTCLSGALPTLSDLRICCQIFGQLIAEVYHISIMIFMQFKQFYCSLEHFGRFLFIISLCILRLRSESKMDLI